jgi:dTDP-4-amino-4,6-dideoxy-D-galactose acyltransferase
MDIKVHELEFDSSLFGYKVGSISLEDCAIDRILQIKDVCCNEEYRLIYFFSKNSICEEILNLDKCFLKMPSKITYGTSKINSVKTIDGNVKIYTKEFVSKSLLKLVYSSGHYSRFKLDINFKNSEFEKLYKLWISKSIKSDKATHVLVYEFNDIELGVLTFNIKDNECIIGLLAVDEKYRNHGIAKSLFNYLFKLVQNLNISKILVDTQYENYIACKFYESMGFKVESILPIYHYWPKVGKQF